MVNHNIANGNTAHAILLVLKSS